MRAYEVFLNGKKLCVAGIGRDGYLSAYVTYRSDPNATWIDVMGLVSRKKQYVRWTQTDLHAGDEILVKIVDRKSVDKYKNFGRQEKPDTESLKRGIRKQAEALGFEVREKRKSK